MSIQYTVYILCGIYIHTRIIDPLDDYWLNTCPIGTPISKCISINQYRYRYRDIDIHRLRHYMIIHGVRLFSKTPATYTSRLTITTNQPLRHLSRVGSNTCPGQVLEIDILRRTETEGQAQCTANRTGSPYSIMPTFHWNPRLIRFLFKQNVSTNHGIIQSNRDTTLSLHPWWGNSILSSRDSTVFQQEKQITLRRSTCHVIQRKLGCSSNEKNKNRTLNVSEEGRATIFRIGHMWKHFLLNKFTTTRDVAPTIPTGQWMGNPGFLYFYFGDGHLFYLVILGPSTPFGSISAGFPSSTSRMGWWLKLEKSSWGFENLNGGWNLQVPGRSNFANLQVKMSLSFFFCCFPKWTFFSQNVSENLKLNSQTSRSGKWFPFQPVQSCHVPTLLTLEDWMIQQTLQPKFGVEI